jgi:hypothetical protein
MKLIGKYALRGYDSVQLASAMQLQDAVRTTNGDKIHFVCSDKTLNDAARDDGLFVLDPADQI